MTNNGLFIAAIIGAILSLPATSVSYFCVNDKNDVISFSIKDSTDASYFEYQRADGENFYVANGSLRMSLNSRDIRVFGALPADAQFSGFSLSLPINDS